MSFTSWPTRAFPSLLPPSRKRSRTKLASSFGVLQLSLFAGMTYQEEVTREHTIDREEAHELVKTWMDDGSIDKWMADPEMTAAEEKITAELESGKITEPPSPVTEVMRQIKNGATAEQAAEAIMTTDTRSKQVAVEVEVAGTKVTIGGMCKGAGMIHPNMATMLCYITTDCDIDKALLQR